MWRSVSQFQGGSSSAPTNTGSWNGCSSGDRDLGAHQGDPLPPALRALQASSQSQSPVQIRALFCPTPAKLLVRHDSKLMAVSTPLLSTWKSFLSTTSPWSRVVLAECRALNSAKYISRMVTIDTVRELWRPFSRLLLSNPLMVFNYLIQRIEGLDGGILNTWVECLKYTTNFSLDVGSYILLQVRGGWR